MNVDINYFSLVLAGVASMIVGFIWYSPMLFGNSWMKLSGYTADSLKKAQKEMGKWYGISFVLSLISAYVLSHIMILSENFFGYSQLSTGLTTAFWMWLGFVMPVQLTDQIFGSKKWKLFIINTGYQLTALLLMAVIVAIL
jgi:hypothetical protein